MVKRVVESEVMHVSGWLGSSSVPAVQCPIDAPYLDSSQKYNTGTGWRLPRGIELNVGAPGMDAFISQLSHHNNRHVYIGAGGYGSSVTQLWATGDNLGADARTLHELAS